MDGAQSGPFDVALGVPQGTILDPLLFLLHKNYLPKEAFDPFRVRLFADDCILYWPIH